MPSVLTGFEYDIFISYRQKDNKYDGWVTEFVENLKKELEATFKDEISVYFDINPHDGLLETHDVGASLKEKLKCLIFIPIISQTYCDPKSFAWQHEFVAFNKLAKEDQFGRDIRLAGGNVASRILPVKIHTLDQEDKSLIEHELGGPLRAIEFIYKESGVNRPLKPTDDKKDNLNKTYYRDQINKVANAVKEIITGLKSNPTALSDEQAQQREPLREGKKEVVTARADKPKNRKARIGIMSVVAFALIVLGYFVILKTSKPAEQVEKSIAVLPFVNLSNDPEQEYFSDGLVDEILDRLVKVGDLKVISRTSSMHYKNTRLSLKEIAGELGVAAILEGSVRKIGNNVRITAQLIDAKTGFHVWSDKYDRDLSDIFSIQSEVALNVAREMNATLTSKETDRMKSAPPTNNQMAYDFFLRGRENDRKGEALLSLAMYTKAIQEDSLFAAAYARRAGVHLTIYWHRNEGWEGYAKKAEEDLKKGFELDPELPDLKLVKALSYYYISRDYDKALKILKEIKAQGLSTGDVYACSGAIYRRQGKWAESNSEYKEAIKLDPFNAYLYDNLSQTYGLLHQYDNQIECCRQGLSLIPDYKMFNLLIAIALLDKGVDCMDALKAAGLKEADDPFTVYYVTRQFDKLIEYINRDNSIVSDQHTIQPKTYKLAFAYYLNGNKSLCKIYADSTINILTKSLKQSTGDERVYSVLGKSHAFIGNAVEAIACGKKAVNLMPAQLDALNNAYKEQDLMEIYIFTGNYDLAMDSIEYLLANPSMLSIGQLMLEPIYDKLRGLPRFQKIIDSNKIKTPVN